MSKSICPKCDSSIHVRDEYVAKENSLVFVSYCISCNYTWKDEHGTK